MVQHYDIGNHIAEPGPEGTWIITSKNPAPGEESGVQGWVVAGLSAPCQDDENLECVSWVHGPFATSTEARAYAETVPPGFRPHILPLEPPMRLAAGQP